MFGKINNVPLKHIKSCKVHFLSHGDEKYTSKELYYTIFEDKQDTTAPHFRFQCQILTTKIIANSVDDFKNIHNPSESSIKHKSSVKISMPCCW